MDNKPSLNKPTKKLETEKIIAKINGKSIPVFKALFAADFFFTSFKNLEKGISLTQNFVNETNVLMDLKHLKNEKIMNLYKELRNIAVLKGIDFF